MASYNSNYSSRDESSGEDKSRVKVGSDQPIDDIAANLMQAIARKGRGFTLGVVDDGDTKKIQVVETLKPHDEHRPLAEDRVHLFTDTPSLISFAKKYGTDLKSIIFIAEEKAVLVIDDSVERGSREQATLDWQASQDWNDWEKLLDTGVVGHKPLLKFLQQHEHNLVNPEMLINLASVSSTATVKRESDLQEMGERVGVVLETTRGESLAKFPKKFNINVPVLDEDNDRGVMKQVTLNVEVVMPDEPLKPIGFKLYTSRWQSTWRERLIDEESLIRKEMPGWLVVKGTANYAAKKVG